MNIKDLPLFIFLVALWFELSLKLASRQALYLLSHSITPGIFLNLDHGLPAKNISN
jgi:hypothetical protein